MKKTLIAIRRLTRYTKKYRMTLYFSIFFTFVTVVLNALMPYLTGLPITRLSENVLKKQAIDFPYVTKTILLILAVGIAYCITQFLANYLITNVLQHAMYDLRHDIETKINRLPVSYFDRHQRGEVLSRVTNDIDAMSNAFQQSFVTLINALMGIILAVAMMFYLNALMAAIAIIMIPLSLLISRFIIKHSQKYFQAQQAALGEMNGFVQEHLSGFAVLKLYGREEETVKNFKKVSRKLTNLGFKSAVFSGLMLPLVQLTAYGSYISVSFIGAYYVLQGLLTVGNLQAFVQYVWQVSQPLGQMTQLSAVLQSASAATERVFEILDEPEEKQEANPIPLPEKVEGRVSFENVSFAYTPDRPLIENFNVEVKPGQMVAIVGPTGAGKTTLINLLMRFYDVTSGAIKIDGIDTKKMRREDVRSLFGMVLQDAWVYHDTIAENIRFGKLDATDYEVIDAAKMANVDHFIRTMPDRYEMMINAEGDNISLGQKQLLTIARAIISDPKILIWDEATSSVDTRLEALIQKAMNKVMEGRTSFVIAHRLSTIREADLILVMNQGQIIEQGTHESLLQAKGFYEKLYNSQFQEEAE